VPQRDKRSRDSQAVHSKQQPRAQGRCWHLFTRLSMLRFCSISGASSSRSSSRRAMISRSVSGSACPGDALQVGTVAGPRSQPKRMQGQVLNISRFPLKRRAAQHAFRMVSATSSGRKKTVPPTRTITPAARRASHRRPAASGDPAAPLPTARALQRTSGHSSRAAGAGPYERGKKQRRWTVGTLAVAV
jgi:hypothetical protein